MSEKPDRPSPILTPKGKPLTPQQLDTLSRVTAQDEQQAIASAFRTIRPYLDASRTTTLLR